MSIFIKAGLWLEKKTGYKGEFNLTRYVTDLITATPPALPYKMYTALLTQTGIDPPVPTVLENTIGTIWFEYDGIGIYYIKSNSLFTPNKVWRSISGDGFQNGGLIFGTAYIDNSTILLLSYNQNNNFDGADDLLGQTPIEIRVYN